MLPLFLSSGLAIRGKEDLWPSPLVMTQQHSGHGGGGLWRGKGHGGTWAIHAGALPCPPMATALQITLVNSTGQENQEKTIPS